MFEGGGLGLEPDLGKSVAETMIDVGEGEPEMGGPRLVGGVGHGDSVE